MYYLDYSLPKSSRYMLFLDAPFRYSWRHLIQYFNDRVIYRRTGIQSLTSFERLVHFGFAFLEVLPILGIALALVDRLLYRKKQDSQMLEYFIDKHLPLYMRMFGPDAEKEAEKQATFILARYIDEMKQSKIRYMRILVANTILDRLSLFGGRFDLTVNKRETICVVTFDGPKKRLRYAFGSDFAGNRPQKSYNLSKVLLSESRHIISQTFDVPMGLLAPFTRLVIHEKTKTSFAFWGIGWLSLVGVYFGVNEHGLIVASKSVSPASKTGVPVHLLIRQILEEAKTTKEALDIILKAKPAASFTLLIAASDGQKEINLSPA